MRDALRIGTVMAAFERLWNKYPDLRFCQIVQNITGPGDHFHVEDGVFAAKLVEFEAKVDGLMCVGKSEEE